MRLVRGGGGGGVLRISSDGDDRRIFLGLKFVISGFLGGGKLEHVSYGGASIVISVDISVATRLILNRYSTDTRLMLN